MTPPFRIAFKIDFDDVWTGGISYYENLFHALRTVASSQDITLLGFVAQSRTHYETLLPKLDEIIQLHPPRPTERSANLLSRILAKAKRYLLPPPPVEHPISKEMRQGGADIAFLRGFPGRDFRIPTLSWFPDFQYLHYPEMFPPAEVEQLDKTIKDIAQYSTRVILSSETAKKDFLQLVPKYAHKACVLSFVSFLDESIYSQSVREICNEYSLPERFIYLPNQFWKHKNHRLVLEALTLARRECPQVVIVSTGLLSDYRDSRYASEFLADVSRSGNRDNFILLGIVPRNHMFAIMRQSLCVIQPSLFEGWSSIVEEVKSLGKTVLLSDIPVHREQNPPSVEYFDPYDAKSLAGKLLLAYEKYIPGPDLTLEEQARKNLQSRVVAFGKDFVGIVKEVLDEWALENGTRK